MLSVKVYFSDNRFLWYKMTFYLCYITQKGNKQTKS